MMSRLSPRGYTFTLGAALLLAAVAAARADDSSVTSAKALHTPQQCDQSLDLQEVAAIKAPKAKKRFKIVFSQVSLAGYYYQASIYGATKAAEDAGVDLTVVASRGFSSQAQQITDVRNQLSRKIDGLVMSPVDVNGGVAAVEAARAANVPVVTVGTLVNTDKANRIVQDDYSQGIAAADYIAAKFPNGGQGIVMGGPANATWALRRVAGFTDGLKKYPNLKISVVTNENVDPAEGLVKFTNATHVYPNVDWLYVAYSGLLPPSTVPVQYSNSLYVAGGLDENTAAAVKAGTASAILPDYPVTMGYVGVSYLVRKLNGEELPPITCVPNGVVTANDLAATDMRSQNLYPTGWTASGH